MVLNVNISNGSIKTCKNKMGYVNECAIKHCKNKMYV